VRVLGERRAAQDPPRPGVVGEAARRAVQRARIEREELIARLRGIALVFNVVQAVVQPGDDVGLTVFLTLLFAADWALGTVLVRHAPLRAGRLCMALDVAVCALVLLNNRQDPTDPVYLIGVFVALEAAMRWGSTGGWLGGAGAGAMVGVWGWHVGGSVEHVTFPLVVLAVVGGITGTLVERLEVERGRLAQLAFTDPLTGLANRQALREELDAALARGDRVAVALVDLDGFKQVNDRLGHAAGDEVLVTAADRMRGEVRDGDLVARLGGDEFVVLVLGRDEDVSAEVAARLAFVIGEPMRVAGEVITVGAACGGVAAGPCETTDVLLGRADRAMYAAKRSA
jgi:diguanylate cyclase (GGDEF)-like protein